jgi:hypothetical protein
VRSKIQDALLSALKAILRPIIKLLLQSGIGYSEFASVAKLVFVQVATDDYMKRGRPANFSQVSAMTGISRKEVSRIRKRPPEERWTPNMEASPVNTILHEWHFDPDFSDGAGTAKSLPFEGPQSFSALVSRYGGDIPPGAMRATLEKAGVIDHDGEGPLSVSQKFFYARSVDEDFIRGLGFSLSSLGSTLVHNATVHQRTDISNEKKRELGRFERVAFSEHMSDKGRAKLKTWVDAAASKFMSDAQLEIGQNEIHDGKAPNERPRTVGVSVYYFEED